MQSAMIVEGLSSSGIFLFLWVVLGKGVFRKFFDLLEEREAKTIGAEGKASELKERARRLQQEISDIVRATRLEALKKRDSEVAAAKSQMQSVVDVANERAAARVQQARNEISKLKENAVKELRGEAEKLAELVVSRVVAGEHREVLH